MNATQLYKFYDSGASKDSSFVPSLTTGTQPPSQASRVAASLPDDTTVFYNAVPTPDGLPFRSTQNQKYPVTYDATPPWVSVPACLANKRKPQARGLGLISPGAGPQLNMPGSDTPVSTLPQRVRAYTY